MRLPTVEDFTGAVVTDAFDDMVHPPGLTNRWAVAGVDHDVVAIRSLSVPPVSQGTTTTARLYLGGQLAQAWGAPVACQWRPDRVTRSTTIDGWRIETVTVCPPDEPGVLVTIEVRNEADAVRELQLGLWLDSAVTCVDGPWRDAEPPAMTNDLTVDGALRWGRNRRADGQPAHGRRSASGPPEPAVSVQGLVGVDHEVADVSGRPRLVELVAAVGAGETWRGAYAQAIASGTDADVVAKASFDRMTGDPAGAIAAAKDQWDATLAALFTPGNTEFGGSLPHLDTTNDALRTLYWWGALGVAWFRRDNPASVLGRTYDTLMPAHWQTTTFIWDYSLSSQVHALLDPEVMRRQITHWVSLDIDRHFGTEWLHGKPVGYWYSVNQYAMTRLVADYVRFTGDVAFLATPVAGPDGDSQSILSHVLGWARSWRGKQRGSELADYGEIDNLLECVSTYVHEVASLNAANVWVMRTAADLADLTGWGDEAIILRREADELLPRVLELYEPGTGVFAARFPDGSRRLTRHCYDYSTVGTTIASDLGAQQRDEMVAFFDTELRTPSWMRALSAADDDAGFSLRPDHQWNGAYPAWPADSARATIALGHPDIVANWLPGLARSTNQGPPGQAHFVPEYADPIEGGARKAPRQWPYLTDWACSSAGAWCELVISGIFGVDAGVDGTVRAAGCLDLVDPDARLTGLVVAGRSYDADISGVRPSAG